MEIEVFKIEFDGFILDVEAEWEKIGDHLFHVFPTAYKIEGSERLIPGYWLSNFASDMFASTIQRLLEKRDV